MHIVKQIAPEAVSTKLGISLVTNTNMDMIEQLQRNVLTYVLTHKEQLKTSAFDSWSSSGVEEKQKIIKEGSKEKNRQEVKVKQCYGSQRRFKTTVIKMMKNWTSMIYPRDYEPTHTDLFHLSDKQTWI